LLAGLVVFALAGPGRAEPPADPLRLVPDQADLFLKVDRPRQLIESFINHDLFKELQQIEAVQELYDSTNYRRFQQLVSYYEKKLGLPWPEMLDRVAGGGMVAAVKIGTDPAPALLVVQATDEAFLKRFVQLSLEILEQELARQEAKDRVVKSSYHGIETLRLGKDLHAAIVGSALLLSNKDGPLHQALDLHLSSGQKSLAQIPLVAEARRLLPADPLAWLWFNLEVAHKAPQAKEIFARPRNDAILTVLFGGLLDVIGRSPFLCASFSRDQDGFLTTIRMPRGVEGLPAELTAHVPPLDNPSALPLLEPKGVLFSEYFYLDPAKFWEKRKDLFNDKQVKTFEDFDKKSAVALLGNRFSQLVTKIGSRHRFVAVNQPKSGYGVTADQSIPGFALVVEMRDPSLGKSLEALTRGAALIAGTQIKMKLMEEKQAGVTIVGYRFPEDVQAGLNDRNFLYNFSPCLAVVRNQFIASSTLELCHEIVDLLQQEAKVSAKPPLPLAACSRLYAAGGAEALQAVQDQLITQTILNQALSPEAAKKQVELFINWIRRLGVLQADVGYCAKDFRFEIRLVLPK
jgi:hypothetical protein